MLYYARDIDYTILSALNEIATTQASPSEFTKSKADMLLDYLATNPNDKLCFIASKMILHIDTDAAYLVALNAKSRIASYFYLGDGTRQIPFNAAIHVERCLLKHVVASASEAETGGVIHNCQYGLHI